MGLDPSQFGLSAHHFSDDDFGATNFLLPRHTSDLRPRNETFLHVDRAQQVSEGPLAPFCLFRCPQLLRAH